MHCGSRQLWNSTKLWSKLDSKDLSIASKSTVLAVSWLLSSVVSPLSSPTFAICSTYFVLLVAATTWHCRVTWHTRRPQQRSINWYMGQTALVATSLRWCTRSFQPKARASIRTLQTGRLSTLRLWSPCYFRRATARIVRHARLLHKSWGTRRWVTSLFVWIPQCSLLSSLNGALSLRCASWRNLRSTSKVLGWSQHCFSTTLIIGSTLPVRFWRRQQACVRLTWQA